jgi:hypothetical protein
VNGKAFFQVRAEELERMFVPKKNVELKMIDGSKVGIVLFNAILLSPLHPFKYVFLIAEHIINVYIVLFIATGIAQDIKFVTNRNLRYLGWNLLKIHNGMGLIGN